MTKLTSISKIQSPIMHFVVFFILLNLFACNSDSKSIQGSFSLSGSVTVKSQTTIDSDVVERNSTFIDKNNSEDDAQSITNPISLGGYLSGRLLEYPEEDIVFSPDSIDIFSVALLEAQTISLSAYYADDDNDLNSVLINLNLKKRTSGESELAASATLDSAGATSLIVPESGEYFIELTASDSSYPVLYVLSLSDTLSVEDSILLKRALNEDFIPNEVLIGKSHNNGVFKAAAANLEEISLKTKKYIGERAALFEIEGKQNKNSINSNFVFKKSVDKQLDEKWSTLKNIQELKQKYPDHYVEPNYIRKATLTPNDTFFSEQWNLRMINAPAAWDITTGSEDVLVAIVDSGIDANHEDLSTKISPLGFDFVSDVTLAGDGDGIDANPADLSTTKHGSHVAGIIGAASNNNAGIASIGFNTTILPLRVLGVENEDGESTGNDADIADAIYYAAGLQNDSGRLLPKAADIINLSLGSAAESATLKNAINAALARNVVVVAASGNDGLEQGFYPAAYEGVIAVGAVTSQGERASFSNYGNYLDVVAPGGASSDQDFNAGEQGILSTIGNGFYAEYIGTSMAAPHVAGTIALIKSINPSVSNNSILSAIQNGLITDQIGQSVFFGGGLINAEKAVSWAQDPNSVPDALAVFPSQLSFADENTNAPLYLSNSGPGSVVVTNIQTSVDWIEVNQINIDNNGLGEYEVRVNNTEQTLLSTEITVTYSVNESDDLTIDIPVIASNTVPSNQNVGNLFISLYSEKAFEEAITSGILFSDYVVSATLSNGVYEYQFNNVLQNNYYMRASTNNDGDRYLFDKGEAVGRYPNLSQFEFINLNQNTSNIDFEVQFLEQNFSSQNIEDNKSRLLGFN